MVSELMVNEIFASVQGESTRIGEPCLFFRLAGCNLSCSYCDTGYAVDGSSASIPALLARAERDDYPLVEITGGEPLLQAAVPEFCRGLLELGRTVLVETNGSLPIDVLPDGVVRIMDCKTPSSACADSFHPSNFDLLKRHDEVKFVIGDAGDYDYAAALVMEHDLSERVSAVLFSPVWGEMAPAWLAERIVIDRLPVRFQLQLHKLIWGVDARGV